MGSSSRGALLIKNGVEYILGRFVGKPEEAARGFFNHQIFELECTNIWPTFRQYHLPLLSKHDQKTQPKSLFLESGLQVELLETARDFSSRQIYRDFLTSHMINTLQSLGSGGDGFYNDLNSEDTWVFVDYVHKIIYIDGVKVLKEGEETPVDTPMMLQIRAKDSSKSTHGIVYLAMESLKESSEMIRFYMEYISWLTKYADLSEDRANPTLAIQRSIGYHFNYFGSTVKQRWRNALDFNHKSIAREFDKFLAVEIPESF